MERGAVPAASAAVIRLFGILFSPAAEDWASDSTAHKDRDRHRFEGVPMNQLPVAGD